jgi:hypothetical protein
MVLNVCVYWYYYDHNTRSFLFFYFLLNKGTRGAAGGTEEAAPIAGPRMPISVEQEGTVAARGKGVQGLLGSRLDGRREVVVGGGSEGKGQGW